MYLGEIGMHRTYGNRNLAYYQKLLEKGTSVGSRTSKRNLPLSRISSKMKYKFTVDIISASAQQIASDAIRDNPTYKVAKLRLDNIIKFATPNIGKGEIDMRYIKKVIDAENIIRKKYDKPLDSEEDEKKLAKAEKSLQKRSGKSRRSKRSSSKILKLPIRTNNRIAAGRRHR